MMPMYLRNCSDERYLEALTKPSRATKPWEVLTDAIRSITNPRAFMGSACGFASGIGFNRLRRVIPSQKWILFAHQVHLACRRQCFARSPKCVDCPLGKYLSRGR